MGYQSLGLCWDGLWSGPIINTLPGFFQKYRPASVVATKKSCTSTIQSQAEGTKDMNTELHFIGSVSEGTDFGQKKNLNQQVYWFMV